MTPVELAALHAECLETPRPWSAAEFGAVMASPGTVCHVQNHGFIVGRLAADEAEILTLAVAAHHRRNGLGRQLVGAFLATAAARGARRAFLEVACDNAPAIALYKSAGFIQVGQRKGYYQRPDGTRLDALVFSATGL